MAASSTGLVAATDNRPSDASPAAPAAGSEEPWRLSVRFDNCTETALLLSITEEDYCDDKFWRFEEVHGRQPRAKLMFRDGDTMFIAERLTLPQGVLVDEDGDAHRYKRLAEPSPPSSQVAQPSANRAESIPCKADAGTSKSAELQLVPSSPQTPRNETNSQLKRPGVGGWGYSVIEFCEDANPVENGSKERGRVAKRQPDPNWGRTSSARKGPRRKSREEAVPTSARSSETACPAADPELPAAPAKVGKQQHPKSGSASASEARAAVPAGLAAAVAAVAPAEIAAAASVSPYQVACLLFSKPWAHKHAEGGHQVAGAEGAQATSASPACEPGAAATDSSAAGSVAAGSVPEVAPRSASLRTEENATRPTVFTGQARNVVETAQPDAAPVPPRRACPVREATEAARRPARAALLPVRAGQDTLDLDLSD